MVGVDLDVSSNRNVSQIIGSTPRPDSFRKGLPSMHLDEVALRSAWQRMHEIVTGTLGIRYS